MKFQNMEGILKALYIIASVLISFNKKMDIVRENNYDEFNVFPITSGNKKEPKLNKEAMISG